MTGTKQKILFILFAIALLCVVGMVARASFTGYNVVTGYVVGMNYTPGTISNGVANVNGQPSTVTTVTQDKYTLIINVNGAVNSYTVTPETYARAQSGQTVFDMKCNSILCAVIE